MVYITGDCHGDFSRFKRRAFPEQRDLTKDDIMIICGDFGGIWTNHEDSSEKYWLDHMNNRKFTTVFVCGNHENYDRLYSEYEVVDFHGGKAHKIRDSIYHLIRGEIYDFGGKTFLAFGGASSHDVDDGILREEDFVSYHEYKKTVKRMERQHMMFRVDHESWWEQELPSKEEYDNALQHLAKVDYKVDYIVSHCAPQSVVNRLFKLLDKKYEIYGYAYEMPTPDALTKWFDELLPKLDFKHWYFGHYHDNIEVDDKFTLLYEKITTV